MDRIKFRGKSIETGKWVYGYFYTIENKEHYILQPCILGVLHTEVIPNTVGQFTGLPDMDGKEVYEGDIVQTGTDKLMVITWSKRFASFCISRDGWAFQHWFGEAFESDDCKVVGNIYENENLLEP